MFRIYYILCYFELFVVENCLICCLKGGNEAETYVAEESCEGLSEEECLMRRTLLAHTDYIYTQKQNP